MEPDIFIPGDQQYQMVNEPLETTGIQNLLPENKIDFRKMAIDAAKKKAIDLTARELGVNQRIASGLAGILGFGTNTFAPLALVSSLTGGSLGISDYLANKRAQKQAAKKRMSDPQGDITTYPTGIMNIQPTSQDIARGTIGTKTTSAPSSVPTSSERGAALHG